MSDTDSGERAHGGATVGQRVQARRRALGLTQTDLAGPDVSPSYVSLIESGKRIPSPSVLAALAARLSCSVRYLAEGVEDDAMERLELALRRSEFLLEQGRGREAVEQLRRLDAELASGRLADPPSPSLAQLHLHVRQRLAEAFESAGMLEDAVKALEALVDDLELRTGSPEWLTAVVSLCRCSRSAGYLHRAIEVGERNHSRLAALGLAETDVAVELEVTLAAAYLFRGDLARAEHLLDRARSTAEVLGEPGALGKACWNASLVAEARGDSSTALALAERALALLGEGLGERHLAQLRQVIGGLLLRQVPPRIDEAEEVLARASEALGRVGSVTDRANCQLERARAAAASNHLERARDLASRALESLSGEAPITSADLHLLLADVALRSSGADEAVGHLRAAANQLSLVGVSRSAAMAYAALARALADAGETAEALSAYRRLTAVLGLEGQHEENRATLTVP